MTKIEINDCVYRVHPVYDSYAADKNGNVINIIKQTLQKGNKNYGGYLLFSAWKKGQNGIKTYQVHRFVYECFIGLIPHGKVTDHINNVRDDNTLRNLQLMSQQQNCKKLAKGRDYKFTAKNHQIKKMCKGH